MNFITSTSYQTGYLYNDSESRAKQGLMSQQLASSCFEAIPNVTTSNNYCSNCYGYQAPTPNDFNISQTINLAKLSTNDAIQKPLVSNNLMYPIYNPPVTYGEPIIPDNAPCVRYIQPE